MEKIIIDGRLMADRGSAHGHIAEKLSLPPYYGANLDALWDCLGELPQGSSLLLINRADMLLSLGDYGKRLLNTFAQAALENGNFSFEAE